MAMRRLQTSGFYGLRTDIIGNAHCISDDEVVYVAGNTLALHNFAQRRQKLNRLPEKRKINFMVISPSRKYAVLGEMGDKPMLGIYDLQSLKKRKLLGAPADPSLTSFSCACFTYDNKYLAAVTNESQTMFFYNLEKGKLESSLYVGNTQIPTKVNLISCNPNDTAIIAVGGMSIFKFLTLSETIWRPYGFSKADNFYITSMAWLNSDRLLAGTIDGKILFLENGDLKNIYQMSETINMNFKIKEEYVVQNTTKSEASLSKDKEYHYEITSIIAFTKGFAFGSGIGKIIFFEKDGQFKYTRRNIYTIPSKILNSNDTSLFRINTISTNPNVDKLVITTGWSQIFHVKLWGPEYKPNSEPPFTEILGNDLHHGPIHSLSTCTWKSHILTVGQEDRSIRVWDYEHQNLILIKQFLQDVSCAILHPSGLFCLIGFSDKLRFMSILIDDLFSIQEFSIRSCKIASFSYAGHMFAAVNTNIIQVYSVIDFKLHYVLKGHIEILRRILWSQDDTKLVSAGTEGAVYQWDMLSGTRLSEVIFKRVEVHGLALSKDGSITYCICSDGQIHEIKENSIIHSYLLPDIVPHGISLGKDEKTLLISSYGLVISITCPLRNPLEFVEYHIHYTDITQMNLTYNEQFLITSDLEGSLCFWKILYPAEETMVEDILYFDQVLISRANLAEKVQTITELRVRLKELEAEHVYKTHQTNLQYNDRLMEIHQSYYEAIEELRDKIEKLEQDHSNELNNINVDIDKTNIAHEEAMRLMEISYDAKLIVEYGKYDKLQEDYNQMVLDYERKLEDLSVDSKKVLDATVTKFENLLQEKQLQLEEAHEETSQQVYIHEIIKTQIEDDTDREIVNLRTNYETKLYEEGQTILKLKGEAGVLRSKHKDCQMEVEDLKWQLNNLREDYAQLMAKKEELENQVSSLTAELKDKETTIIDKNKNISDLNRTNIELEKYKFVLNERINELREEIEPRDKEIKELKLKITDMETELLGLNKLRQTLELRHFEMNGKLRATGLELLKEEQNRKRYQRLITKIRIDLLETVGLIDDPTTLKNSVIKLYRKYSNIKQLLHSHKADMDVQCEFKKQRAHMENTIAVLQKQLIKKNRGANTQFDKVMEDNLMLLTEVSALREELQSAQRHITDMNSLLGLRTRHMTPMQAKATLVKACHASEELERHYKESINECHKVINVLKEDIDRLMGRSNPVNQNLDNE